MVDPDIEAKAQRIWNRFLDRNRHHFDYGGVFGVTGGTDEERRRVGDAYHAEEDEVRAEMARVRGLSDG